MSSPVIFVVLAAALLHAVWNFLVKKQDDKYLSMCAVVLGHSPFALLGICFSPLPGKASIAYILAGVALHVGYQFFLLLSYRFGDLSQVYPLARGVAPLLVAGVSATLLGTRLSWTEMTAIGIIAAGIMSLALIRREDGLRNGKAAIMAIGTGTFIAAYSLVDGLGAREAGTSLGFYSMLSFINALAFAAIMHKLRPGLVRMVVRRHYPFALFGGGASFIAYALVTYAFTVAPLPLVAALRETSIVFALLLGIVVLKEPLNPVKVLATFCTLLGVGILRLGR